MNIYKTPQHLIEEYYNSPSLNQSSLKDLRYGLGKFLENREKFDKDLPLKSYFKIGEAVDTLLTEGEESFKEKFYISVSEKKPSETEINILQKVLEKVLETNNKNISEVESLSKYPTFIFDAITEVNWQPKWKNETRINKIIETGAEYFEILKASFGKEILLKEEADRIFKMQDALLNDERTKKYFNSEEIATFPNVEIYYQVPIYFDFEGIPCKALLDLIVVNKDTEGNILSLEPIDLKTTSGFSIEFPNSARSFRYDIQAAWYSDAILNPTAVFPEHFPKLPEHIVLENFKFIVISTTKNERPVIYKTSEDFLNCGRFGTVNPSGQKTVKGYIELLGDFRYYENSSWEEEKVISNHDGILTLSWDGIIEEYEQ